MKLTQIAILLSGAALSASVLAAGNNRLGIPNIGDETDLSWQYTPKAKPFFSGSSTQASQAPMVRVGDETDTSWQYAPKAKPAFNSRPAATGSSAE
jgi:hypothetical protein